MSKGAINFSEKVEYFTPKCILDTFGRFDYDPATTEEIAKEHGISQYDTIKTDGLTSDWTPFKRIWINPPFTLKKDFLRKAQETYDKTGADIFILLPISYLTTKQFHDVCRGGRVFLPNGRIKFQSGEVLKSPAFGSVIVKLEKEWSITTLNLERK